MRAFVLRKKKLPSYSKENYVFLARDKTELLSIVGEKLEMSADAVARHYKIEEHRFAGQVYVDIY